MKNYILIAFGLTITVFVIFVRIKFHNKLEEFRKEITEYGTVLSNSITNEKQLKLISLRKSNINIANKFNAQFSLDSAVIKKDTSFSYLYLKKIIPYNFYSVNYIECLVQKCKIDIEQEEISIEISKQKDKLLKRYGENSFNYWFNNLKDNKLFIKEKRLTNCNDFFKSKYIITYDKSAWNAFEALLRDYNYESQNIKTKNDKERNELDKLLRTFRAQLNGLALDYFNGRIKENESQFFENETIEKVFQTAALGNITYSLIKETFRKDRFNIIAETAQEFQWSTNSLNNGAMPYYYCYGASNSCDDYNCSQIKIINGGTDVVVFIKTTSSNVLRHAYVKAGYSFTFNIPDGTYNVYFYSGIGWNPNKIMSQGYCTIQGGFVKSESTGKDTNVRIYGQVLSYQLQQVVNGNFSMESSSKSEVFN